LTLFISALRYRKSLFQQNNSDRRSHFLLGIFNYTLTHMTLTKTMIRYKYCLQIALPIILFDNAEWMEFEKNVRIKAILAHLQILHYWATFIYFEKNVHTKAIFAHLQNLPYWATFIHAYSIVYYVFGYERIGKFIDIYWHARLHCKWN